MKLERLRNMTLVNLNFSNEEKEELNKLALAEFKKPVADRRNPVILINSVRRLSGISSGLTDDMIERIQINKLLNEIKEINSIM